MTSRSASAARSESSPMSWAPALGMAMTIADAAKFLATWRIAWRSPATGTPLIRSCRLYGWSSSRATGR
jgi:hypothetical protein